MQLKPISQQAVAVVGLPAALDVRQRFSSQNEGLALWFLPAVSLDWSH